MQNYRRSAQTNNKMIFDGLELDASPIAAQGEKRFNPSRENDSIMD